MSGAAAAPRSQAQEGRGGLGGQLGDVMEDSPPKSKARAADLPCSFLRTKMTAERAGA